jgi:hypothetical protein
MTLRSELNFRPFCTQIAVSVGSFVIWTHMGFRLNNLAYRYSLGAFVNEIFPKQFFRHRQGISLVELF